ncbi:MAG: twin-arginine translocase TatA/TatE family subunit [Planctomycetaceae bacterium]|nr:twin-arginine translocase TatA/TatE family subunit [Planctomycetaceae bacterium]
MPFVGGVSSWELIIVAVVALLLFGKRLPEVARSVGKGIVEFKKGVAGIEDEVKEAARNKPARSERAEAQESLDDVKAPKFEPPVEEPQVEEPQLETKDA